MAVLKAKYAAETEVPEDYKALYEERGGEWVLVQIDGIKTEADVTRVQRALTAEKEAHKKTRQTFDDILDGRKPEEVKAQLDRIPELEAATGQLDETKINTLVEARVKARITPIERERDQLKQQVTERDGKIVAFETKEKLRTVSEHVTAAARKAKVQESAIEDVVMHAERIFQIDEGKVLTPEGISPEVWLTDMGNRKPHWWGPTQGGGGRGGNGNGFAGNPWTADNWSLTKQGEVMRQSREKAEQMARAAGSSIGATKAPASRR
jgi:hypothetical protein